MPEGATTPDLLGPMRLAFEAANRRDLDAVISFYASDAVFQGRLAGDTFEGRSAIRNFLEEWFGAYEELTLQLEDVGELGSGVVFAVVFQEGVLAGGAGDARVSQREGWAIVWEQGLIARHAVLSTDIEEARAAAEALAESRG